MQRKPSLRKVEMSVLNSSETDILKMYWFQAGFALVTFVNGLLTHMCM